MTENTLPCVDCKMVTIKSPIFFTDFDILLIYAIMQIKHVLQQLMNKLSLKAA